MSKFPFARLPIFILVWAAYQIVNAPAALLGLVITPFLYNLRMTEYNELQERWYWQLIRPWVNPEDWYGQRAANWQNYGSVPWWWYAKYGDTRWHFYRYHAIRNPSNGLRSYPLLACRIDSAKFKYVTNVVLTSYEPSVLRWLGHRFVWYFCWQKYKAGFNILIIWNEKRHLNLLFGWRIRPQYRHQMSVMQSFASFATKFLPYRRG